jgi:hypothetical protein
MSLKLPQLAGQALLLAAVIALALALGWWWRTFGQVVNFGYLSWREAGSCLLSDNDICSLAKALCLGAHPRLFVAYWSAAFWTSLGLLSLSLIVRSAALARKM